MLTKLNAVACALLLLSSSAQVAANAAAARKAPPKATGAPKPAVPLSATELISRAALSGEQGDLEKAQKDLQDALNQARAGKSDRLIVAASDLLGAVLERLGKYEEAKALYIQEIETKGRLNDEIESASTYERLARLCDKQGKHDEGQKFRSEETAARTRDNAGKPADMGQFMENVQRRISETWSHPASDGSYAVRVSFSVDKAGNVANTHISKSSGLPDLDMAALSAIKAAGPFGALPSGGKNPAWVSFTFNVNDSRHGSIPGLNRSLQSEFKIVNMQRNKLGVDHLEVGVTMTKLGEIYTRVGMYPEAHKWLEQAMDIEKKDLAENSPCLAELTGALGELYYLEGKYDQAEPLLQKALTVTECSEGKESPLLLTYLEALGKVYYKSNRVPQGNELYARIKAIKAKAPGSNELSLVASAQVKPKAWTRTPQAVPEGSARDAEGGGSQPVGDIIKLQRGTGDYRDCSKAFVSEIRSAVDAIPPQLHALIMRKGVQVVLAPRIVDCCPELQNNTPRGWEYGSTYRQEDGLFNGNIMVSEWRGTYDDDRALEKTTQPENVLRHEFGHAVDWGFDELSQTEDFKHAYLLDIGQMDDGTKAKLQYYVQKAEAGPQEAFAELFATMYGSQRYSNMLSAFPRATKVMRDRIKTLGVTPP